MRVSLWSPNCVIPFCAECTLPQPLPPSHPPPPERAQDSFACASAETVQCLSSQNSYIIDENTQVLTAGIRRLIRILFVSTRSDVCYITKAVPGVLKSWGERPFIFRAGPHNPHGPYFYCAEKLRSDGKIMVVR